MRSFPPAPDLHFLIGKQLGQVCLDPNSVQLHFWNGGGIHIDHDVDHVTKSGQSCRYDCAAHTGPPLLLHRLIARTIASIDVEPFRLALLFDDGQCLILHSEESAFECGHIWQSDDDASEMIVY
ncbi:hypothetical protein [Sphingopyxis sp. DBS4]|uniref:hypothetical protein n=1 Tax=Sphingopyxis sp. DBS4 TaxID=2968500 RepID=UPI00214CF802|nr:hypothetical protein [Sphingopyxis sp. DBS4]